MRKFIFSVLAASMAASAAPAVANEASVVVGYDDLDLSDPDDFAVLERRLADAAKEVCRAAPTHSVTDWSITMRCRADAFKAAMAEAEARVAPEPSKPLALAD